MWNWFRRRTHRQLLESYALLETGKWSAIVNAANDVCERGGPFLLVAHFPATFEEAQKQLSDRGLDYAINPEFMTPQQLTAWVEHSLQPIHLVLANQLKYEEVAGVPPEKREVFSIVVCERHPWSIHDIALQKFVGALPQSTRLGYFFSLEEPLVHHAIGDMAIKVMQQLGLNEHELITSQILSRRIDRFIKKISAQVKVEVPTDSAEDWLRGNGILPVADLTSDECRTGRNNK